MLFSPKEKGFKPTSLVSGVSPGSLVCDPIVAVRVVQVAGFRFTS
jgi:hypothetical protein